MTVDQISVFVENKAGALAGITEELAAAGVNLRALSIAETHDFGVLCFIADDEETAAGALREARHVFSLTPVLAVLLKDEPGSFAKTVRVLADAEIDVEYIYAFVTPRSGHACMIFRVADNKQAEQVLADAGIAVAGKAELE